MSEAAEPSWLNPLKGLQTGTPKRPGYIILALIQGRDAERYEHRFAGLVMPNKVRTCLRHPGGIGNRVESSGPGPIPPALGEKGNYKPRFWIPAPKGISIEPLVDVWKENNTTVLQPNSGLLMTYGLVPRIERTQDGEEVHWDDPDRPLQSVLIVESPSKYSFPEHSPARVEIRREYLIDYATLRGKSVIETSFVEARAPATAEDAKLLGTETVKKWEPPGKTLHLRVAYQGRDYVIGQASTVKLVLEPGEAPISAGRWDYGELIWPGHSRPITKDHDFITTPSEVFVHDGILREYEDRGEFQVSPLSGCVSYGNQWSIGETRRVGRDFIAVNLKKLYKGTPPEIVRLVHAHAKNLSDVEARGLAGQTNIAARTERLIKSQIRLAQDTCDLMNHVTEGSRSVRDLVELDPSDLAYRGWWTNPLLSRLARQVPQDMTRDAFLGRCVDLDQFIAESWSQRELRLFLKELGDDPAAISGLRSLGLLKRLLDLSGTAYDAGLRLREDFVEVRKRLPENSGRFRIAQGLNALRNARSHRTDQSARVRDAYKQMNLIQPKGQLWGLALDTLYDALSAENEAAAEIVAQAADDSLHALAKT